MGRGYGNYPDRNKLSSGGFLPALGNFLLNFVVAVTWLGRWTIRLLAGLWQRWGK